MDKNIVLKDLLLKGLELCSPERAVQQSLELQDRKIKIKKRHYSIDGRPIYLFAVGKAAVPMYRQAREILGDHITKSLVITSDEEAAETCSAGKVMVGSHPEPDKRSLEAGNRALSFIRNIPTDSLVLCLISGGTSSLLTKPANGISISDLANVYKLLNNSGASIYEINTVRKHCSSLKGGQLLRYLRTKCIVIDLVISDVPGDELSIIGSGPTIPDSSTFEDAKEILHRYDLWDALSKSIQDHIKKGEREEVRETVKPGEDPIEQHQSEIISSARMLAYQIRDIATNKGWRVTIADKPFNEDVEIVAGTIADGVLSEGEEKKWEGGQPKLFIFWGESTVRVSGEGKGGRNQELALHGALNINGFKNITWLSAGTDGIDGPTDAAGAIVNGTTISKAREKNLDPKKYLKENDSYHFHQQMGTLLKTGPTGNNLMDIVLVLIA